MLFVKSSLCQDRYHLQRPHPGAVTPSKLVTHRLDIDDALNAYELILGKTAEPYLGIVLTYGEQPVWSSGSGLRYCSCLEF